MASHFGNVDIVNMIIQKSPDFNLVDNDNNSALTAAILAN